MPIQAQDHLHLDTDLSGAPENAPTNHYSAGIPETRNIRAFVTLEWAVDGTLMAHKVTSSGDPVISESRPYHLRVTRSELTALIADLGHRVYFVPPYHPDNGEDHTAYRDQVEFYELRDIESECENLNYYRCTVVLQYDSVRSGAT
jgi:hypothetical protein